MYKTIMHIKGLVSGIEIVPQLADRREGGIFKWENVLECSR